MILETNILSRETNLMGYTLDSALQWNSYLGCYVAMHNASFHGLFLPAFAQVSCLHRATSVVHKLLFSAQVLNLHNVS